MFHNTFQTGVISILSAYGSDPIQLWDVHLDPSESENEGRGGLLIRRNEANIDHDHDDQQQQQANDENKISGPAIELSGTRLSQNYIICPPIPTKFATATATATTTIPKTTTRPSLGITLPYLYLTIRVPQQFDFSFEVTILDNQQRTRRFRASAYQTDKTVIKPDICTLPLRLKRKTERLKRDAVLLPLKKKQKVQFNGTTSSGNNSNPYMECNKSYDDDNYYGPASVTHHHRGGGDDNNDDSSTAEEDDEGDNNNYYDSCKVVSCWNRICIPLSEYTKQAYGTEYVETKWVQIHANCQLKRVYFAEKEMDEDDELPEEFRLYHCPS